MGKQFFNCSKGVQRFCFVLMVLGAASCANRGFKLSQQMPGMDNQLNPINIEGTENKTQFDKYDVAADGSVLSKRKLNSRISDRKLASSRRQKMFFYTSDSDLLVRSTLDPQNGAVLLGE